MAPSRPFAILATNPQSLAGFCIRHRLPRSRNLVSHPYLPHFFHVLQYSRLAVLSVLIVSILSDSAEKSLETADSLSLAAIASARPWDRGSRTEKIGWETHWINHSTNRCQLTPNSLKQPPSARNGRGPVNERPLSRHRRCRRSVVSME